MVKNEDAQTIIKAIKARGWEDTTRTVLDIIEPLAPLVSQLLWTLQPAARILGAHHTVNTVANLLDSPDGIAYLQTQLAANEQLDED